MKKLKLVITFSLFLIFNSYAQPIIEWQRAFGGSDDDLGYGISLTLDGGYIITGYSNSSNGDVTINKGGDDLWIIKLDAGGNLQWEKTYGGGNNDIGRDIKQTSDRGFIIAGRSSSNNGDVSNNHGYIDAWIIKVDNNGNIQWQQSYGGTDWDEAQEIVQTADGGFVFVGFTHSNNGDVSGNHSANPDIWVVKLNNSGIIQWQKCLGGIDWDQGFSIQQTPDSEFIVSGYSGSNGGDVTFNYGFNDYWLIKLGSTGNLLWQKSYGGSDYDDAMSLILSSDGDYVMGGWSGSSNGTVTGNYGYYDFWVLKVDTLGNVKWQKSLGGSFDDACYSIHETIDHGFIVCGYSNSTNYDVGANYGLQDYWVVKLDNAGNILWEKNLGGSNEDRAFSIKQNSNGDYIVAGWTNSDDFDVSNLHGLNYDIWIVKLTGNINAITGKVYVDLNNDMVYNAGEPVLQHHQVSEPNTGRYDFTNANGNYNVTVLDSGYFSVVPSPLPYYNSVPVNHSITFNGIQQKDSLNDFAFQSTGAYNDLCMELTPLGPFRSGFNGSYRLDYQNVGTTTLTGTVIFYPDSNLSYVSSTLNPTYISVDSIVWNVGSLTPFQTGNINVTFLINTGLTIGSLIYSTAHINPVTGDANPQCNYAAWEVYTTGSVDPNAIFVDKEVLETTQFPNPPYLDYIIYFQNTGNDTAFTVKIMDEIPAELNMSTLKFVSSSHPITMRNIPVSRFMEFKFDNILLPDSTVNEPSSHGFIRYRIKPETSLVLGDSIKNSALIYFDFNQPVLTNIATTAILLPTGIASNSFSPEQKIFIFPNPASGELTVKWLVPVRKNENSSIKIFDMMGRIVYQKQTASEKNQQIKIDVSQFPSGLYVVQLDNNRKIFVRE